MPDGTIYRKALPSGKRTNVGKCKSCGMCESKLATISSQTFSLFLMARLKEIGQLLLSLFFLDQTKSKSRMFLPRSYYSLIYNTDI